MMGEPKPYSGNNYSVGELKKYESCHEMGGSKLTKDEIRRIDVKFGRKPSHFFVDRGFLSGRWLAKSSQSDIQP